MIATVLNVIRSRRNVTTTSKPRENIINNAALAQHLRRRFYAADAAPAPRCDRCNAPEAWVTAGALNYCDDCRARLGAKQCLSCGQEIRIGDTHACSERPC